VASAVTFPKVEVSPSIVQRETKRLHLRYVQPPPFDFLHDPSDPRAFCRSIGTVVPRDLIHGTEPPDTESAEPVLCNVWPSLRCETKRPVRQERSAELNNSVTNEMKPTQ